MKNLFKVAAVAVLSLGFGVAANAQNGKGTNSIDATATVLSNIEVEGTEPLEFGQIMPGFAKYVPMTDGNLNATSNTQGGNVNRAGVQSGLFKLFAAPGTSIAIGLALTPMVNEDDVVLPLDFNKGLSPTGTETTVAWSTGASTPIKLEVDSEEANTIATFPTNPLENDKNGILVYVGGTVRPSGTQASGIYSGSLTLTATYN
jgi:hypothetical protein